jgi:hypothetical protein
VLATPHGRSRKDGLTAFSALGIAGGNLIDSGEGLVFFDGSLGPTAAKRADELARLVTAEAKLISDVGDIFAVACADNGEAIAPMKRVGQTPYLLNRRQVPEQARHVVLRHSQGKEIVFG